MEGDVIVVDINDDERTVSFRKNDDESPIATVTDIERGEYRVAVCMYYEGSAVSFA